MASLKLEFSKGTMLPIGSVVKDPRSGETRTLTQPEQNTGQFIVVSQPAISSLDQYLTSMGMPAGSLLKDTIAQRITGQPYNPKNDRRILDGLNGVKISGIDAAYYEDPDAYTAGTTSTLSKAKPQPTQTPAATPAAASTLAPQAQTQYDQLIKAGASPEAARNAVAQIPGATTAAASAPTQDYNAQLQQLLSNPSLTADQKALAQQLFQTVSTGDANRAKQLQSAMQAAMQYSDPFFKAQIRMATDELTRGFQSIDGDLSFKVDQEKTSLEALHADIAASKDNLSFEANQQLKGLQRDYETNLEGTRDSLAASGFTSSSRRVRAETVLDDSYKGAVESTNRGLSYQTGRMDRQLATQQTNTAAQIANLQRIASEGKLDLYRKTEGAVGSNNLPSFGGLQQLGGVGGTIPRQQALDAASFANSMIF